MTDQLTYAWSGYEGEILDVLLAPGRCVTQCSEYLSRFGIKVVAREPLSDGYRIIIRHPRGALAHVEVDAHWIVSTVKKYSREEALKCEDTHLFKMHPADAAHIKRVVKEGETAWDLMVGLDQANYKFASLENRSLEEGGRVIVLQGKLFGILVLTFDAKDACTHWEILEGDAARRSRMAIAQRMQAAEKGN